MTNSPAAGTKSGHPVIGRHAFALLVVTLTLVGAVVASMSAASDLARHDIAFRPAEPWIWELSSAASLLIWLLPVLRADEVLRARVPSAAARLGVRVLGSAVYAALHVAAMVALRHVAYAIAGWSYRFGPWLDGFIYEYRKDALTFALILAIGWRAVRARAPAPSVESIEVPAAGAATALASPNLPRAHGQRRCAGSHARDRLDRSPGQARLMRQTLAEMETRLAGHGFIRTHRRALVNRERVQAIIPPELGELGVRLLDGQIVPLSESRRAEVLRLVLGASTVVPAPSQP